MAAFFILGFFSLTLQVFVLKELSGLLTAHELSIGLGLAAWLGWTAAGIGWASGSRRLKELLLGPGGQTAAYGLLALAAALNFMLIKQAGLLLKPGLMPGLFELLTLSALLTLPVGLANGLCAFQGLSRNTMAFYWAETLGAAAGGLFTLAYAKSFPGADPIAIAGALALALVLASRGGRALTPGKALFAAGACVLFFLAAAMPPPFALPGYFAKAAAFARTTGSRLAVVAGPSQKTFVEDGAVLAQFPDPETRETRVHPAMLAHKKPESVLFLGAGGFFLADEARKHAPKEIAVAEPDRFKTAFILENAGLSAAGVRVLDADPRKALRDSPAAWDLIFQTAPAPLNAAANRYFTLEFFREAARALKPGGILAFSLPFSENYLPPVRAYFAASILASAGAAFEHVELIPGGTLTVLASGSPLDLGAGTLAKRYAARRLKNSNVVPESLPFLLDPYRAQWARAMLQRTKRPPLNTDLDPAAYFYLWKLWLSMFVSPAALTGLGAMFILAALLLNRLLRPGTIFGDRAAAGVFLTGFWAMGFEMVLLLLFQTAEGQLNWKMGTLFSAFMAGAAAGAAVCDRIRPKAALYGLPCLALALTAWLYAAAPGLAGAGGAARFALFFGALFAGGALMGGYFAAARTRSDAPETLYAADLLGAAAGAFLVAGAVVPLFGMRSALLVSAAAVLPCFFLVKGQAPAGGGRPPR